MSDSRIVEIVAQYVQENRDVAIIEAWDIDVTKVSDGKRTAEVAQEYIHVFESLEEAKDYFNNLRREEGIMDGIDDVSLRMALEVVSNFYVIEEGEVFYSLYSR